MVIDEKNNRNEQVLAVAKAMMAAARTAPKGKGVDNLEILTLTGKTLEKLSAEMRRYAEEAGFQFFLRDAGNVEEAEAVVLIGTGYGIFNLNCGYCGFQTCAEKSKFGDVPCAFNINDLGIAVGSAASVAADNRIDSRVMYSAGKAALNLGLLAGCRAAFGIVLNCRGKNPFFDRSSNSAHPHKP